MRQSAARPARQADALRPAISPVLCSVAEWLAEATGRRRLLLSMGLGGISALAMPPTFWAPLLLVTVPALLWLSEGARRPWSAFAVGWGFGFGFFVFGLYWIAFALTIDLARFFWMIPFAVAGLPALLGVFPGFVMLALTRWAPQGLARPVAFAVLWGSAEWLRGHVLTGFPWNLMGYTWVGWLPTLQSVSVVGIYGLSLLTMLAAALPAAILDRDRRCWRTSGVVAAGLALGLLAALSIGGTLRLAGESGAVLPGIQLRLVQPNIAQADKWVAELRARHVAHQIALSRGPGFSSVTHVVWPETAVPYFLDQSPAVREALASAVPVGGLLITGVPRRSEGDGPVSLWNSLQALDSSGSIVASYDKFHLVPFGEYVPFRSFLPIEKVTGGTTDFSPGPGPRTLDLDGLPPFSPLICYEVIFPGRVSEPKGEPRWLLNLTNDAWYGETAGPHQHFAIAQTRAVETGLPMVRVASTGISGVVDPLGRVVARLELGTEGVLDSPLPAPLPTETCYQRWGDAGFWALIALLTVVSLIGERAHKKH